MTALFSLSAVSLVATMSPPPDDPHDLNLCVMAQQMVAAQPQLDVDVVYGEGNGFHTIQMDIDVEQGRAVVAAATQRSGFVDERIVSVACKMVNAERVADVLQLAPVGNQASCQVINERTYAYVLDGLTPAQASRYRSEGVPLRFGADYVAASGGEWLPSRVDDHIRAVRTDDGALSHVEVSAPAVRVPWDPIAREFYQGTQHCKLISATAVRRWVLTGAFDGSTELFPPTEKPCYAPSAESSAAGSCLFWFAPAQSMFCKDYTGPEWTAATAQNECGKRHASPQALAAAASRYEGAGGIYRQQACAERTDAAPLGGTCVFHCNAPDESLWRLSGDLPADGAGAMTRACDLYID